YASSALQEGASTYTTKLFSGIITFADVSELKNELQVSSNKTKSGEELTWTWTITSLTEKKAEDIKATFTLPNYVNGDITDIVITKGASSVAGDMNHLNGTTSLGNLEQRESIVITFKSVARGDPEWHEAIGRLDWSDTTPSSPHYNESKQPFKILDDEQTDTPKDSLDMGILSVPIYFNFGMQDIDSTLQTYSLHTLNYQSNTNVVTDGFYTRVKDERSSNTGWELTASLSEFVDKSGIGMPNGSGTSLKLHNMSIEKVTNRDTPQEGIDPSPSGTPSTVKTTETLVAGDAAKTVVDAGASEGDGTWQLRMPFTDLSLNVPANAGKKGTVYQAKLTWSLNSTP
ncbi:WxL domain-containing protein, partial [Enterococcus pallens]